MIMKKYVTRATVWLGDAFLIVLGQQLSSAAQSNKIYQALETPYLLVGNIKCHILSFHGA